MASTYVFQPPQPINLPPESGGTSKPATVQSHGSLSFSPTSSLSSSRSDSPMGLFNANSSSATQTLNDIKAFSPYSTVNASILAVLHGSDLKDLRPPGFSVHGKKLGRPRGSTKNTHIARPVVDSDDETMVCKWEFCSAEFTNEAKFFEHVKEAHMVTGDTKKLFTCMWEGCTKPAFESNYVFQNHMRVHTTEKPFWCNFPFCNKQYSRRENLKTHKRTHTGEKPYACQVKDCDRKFTNASDRAKHQNRVHSAKKPYGCLYPLCLKKYTDPSSLRKHIKGHHPDYDKTCAPFLKPVKICVTREEKEQAAIELAMKNKAAKLEKAKTTAAMYSQMGMLQQTVTAPSLISAPSLVLNTGSPFIPFPPQINPLLASQLLFSQNIPQPIPNLPMPWNPMPLNQMPLNPMPLNPMPLNPMPMPLFSPQLPMGVLPDLYQKVLAEFGTSNQYR